MIGADALAAMSDEDKLALVELLEAKLSAFDRNRLSRYAPYPKQLKFHAAGGMLTVRERLLIAANQCLTPWTFLETPEGALLAGETWSGPAGRVLAPVDGQICAVPWRGGMLRSIEPAFRVVLDNGQFFDCSRMHQVWTPEGWLSFDQLMSRGGGLHCWQRAEDFLASCVADGHLHGPQLRRAADSARELPPSPDGAQTHSPLSWTHEDAEARTPERIRAYLASGPIPISGGALPLPAALFELFAGPKLPQSALRTTWSSQVLPRFVRESKHELQSTPGVDPGRVFADYLQRVEFPGAGGTPGPHAWGGRAARQYLSVAAPGHSVEELCHDASRIGTFYPFDPPELWGGVRVLVVVPLGFQPIIDCQVPDHHCYLAGGVLHHNCGKTVSAAAETAYHLTGNYPADWPGARWDYAPCGWAGSVTAQGTRDSVQRMLMGKPGEWGTGMIPGDSIIDIKRAAGAVPDCIDTVTVRHASGGIARLTFKYYEQGREKWQAETLDFVWLDEEPEEDIYFEALTRTNAVQGILYLTFTPLKGMSKVVKRFLREKAPGTFVVHMGLEDALHYTPEAREALIARYPAHEREARAKGIPTLGSGLIYPVPESQITVPAFSIPRYWPRICGLDFGWDHPTAAGWLAWDRDADVVYVTDAYKCREQTPVVHAAAIRARGSWIPIAWPHDGVAHDKGGGIPLADQYRAQGCNMLPEKATHAPVPGEAEGTGNYTVEPGVLEILDRMQTGRFKVFSHLNDVFEETRLYHRENGKIIKEDDDLMDAIRTGVMMLRHAKVKPLPASHRVRPTFVPADAGAGY